jgi:hypothetical protein
MSATVHYLHGHPQPIGQFLRVGNSGHRQLETLHSAGRLPVDRVVVEAAWLEPQRDLVRALRDAGTEIVLDTNVAELSALGRYEAITRRLPWGEESRPLVPDDFSVGSLRDICGQIARFAVAAEVDVVLAPAHFVEGARSKWEAGDVEACKGLRRALDAEGGSQIAIDYPLITTYGAIREAAQRRAFISLFRDLPIDNLWLRISGFGADASPTGVRRYVSAVADFHALDRPIVADCVGGLTGLAIVAFGTCGAIAHGAAEKERFEGSSWHAPRREGGGGQSGRVYIPALDRQIKLKDAVVLMEARGARRLLACRDDGCCPRGADDMFRDPKAHFLTQRNKQLRDLSQVPEGRRIERFLDDHLTAADRMARQAAKLRTGNDAIDSALARASIRLDRMRSVLEDLYRTIGDEYSRSASPQRRLNPSRRASGQAD